jgi:Domain of unknown function (DUF4301)
MSSMSDRAEFSDTDRADLHARGIPIDEGARQLRLLREHPPAIRLERPCTPGDGIVRLDASRHRELLAAGERAAADGRITKFVPASGAATRMFKDMIEALNGGARPSQSPAGRTFFERLDQFPFSHELRQRAGIAGVIVTEADERTILRTLLHDMRYAELPKALIPFHRGRTVRTAFEEHLLEATQYGRARDGRTRVHFTVAPEFREEFQRLLHALVPGIASDTGARVDVGFSDQHASTDTLALGNDAQPFRTGDGRLLFRPAGHGALLQNLQALAGDLVVIKNIDNIVPFEQSQDVVHWKRLLIGYLATLLAEHAADRPLRVCGVVKNEGEPGGAPFWVVDRDGRRAKQIVESSQVDLHDPDQRRIFESSTHFNPVDLVCALRAPSGEQFDLAEFVDPSAVFLSKKTHEGRELTALERPGLWNGAMAHWHTVFVEVPAATFAPVKTVFDLLRPQHQSL